MPDPAPDAQYDEYGFPLNVYSNLVSAPTQAPAPVPAPTPAPAPAPAVQPAPVTPAPVAATLPPGPNPAQQQNAAMWNRISRQFGTLPLSQAETAVEAALRFNALRGYQDDMAAGVPQPESLAKWAPFLYSGPKSGTIGQAAALVRAQRGPSPVAPRYEHIGKRLLRVNPDQSVTDITPEEDPNIVAARNVEATMDRLSKGLTDPRTTEDQADQYRQQLRDLPGVAQAYRMRARQTRPTTSTSTGSTGRVRVRHPKTGRIGTIPASQLDQALREGYSQVQ